MDLDLLKKNPKTQYLVTQYEQLLKQEEDIRTLIASDDSMKELGEEDLAAISVQKQALEEQITAIETAEKEEEEFPNEIVLEARAGAGGDEAALFAQELVAMYERFAQTRGWQTKHTDDYSLEIKGKDVYRLLRYETGVHRVQRVPVTEKNGRIHKSTDRKSVG